MEDLVTTSGIFHYTFVGFKDQTSDSEMGPLSYSNTAFRECGFWRLTISQGATGLDTHVPLSVYAAKVD